MAIEPRRLINDDLLHQVEEAARSQNRQPEEVVSEALRKYLDELSWVRALSYGRQRAEAVGITTEEGVDKAISDWRRENQPSGL